MTFAGVDAASNDLCALRLQALGAHVIAASEIAWTSLGDRCDYDLVVLSRRSVAKAWLPLARSGCPYAPVVFDTVDLHFVREFRELALERAASYDVEKTVFENAAVFPTSAKATKSYKTWRENVRVEVGLANASDATVVVSPAEARELIDLQARGELRDDLIVEVVSNIHDVRRRSNATSLPFPTRKGALFVGNWQHPPNVNPPASRERDFFRRGQRRGDARRTARRSTPCASWWTRSWYDTTICGSSPTTLCCTSRAPAASPTGSRN